MDYPMNRPDHSSNDDTPRFTYRKFDDLDSTIEAAVRTSNELRDRRLKAEKLEAEKLEAERIETDKVDIDRREANVHQGSQHHDSSPEDQGCDSTKELFVTLSLKADECGRWPNNGIELVKTALEEVFNNTIADMGRWVAEVVEVDNSMNEVMKDDVVQVHDGEETVEEVGETLRNFFGEDTVAEKRDIGRIEDIVKYDTLDTENEYSDEESYWECFGDIESDQDVDDEDMDQLHATTPQGFYD